MTIASISANNTFLEHVVKTNEISSWINGAEAGTSQVQNTSVTGAVFKVQSNNSGISVSDTSVEVDDIIYISVGTLGTDISNTATHIIASMNVVNTVHQTTRSAFSSANDATTTASAAFAKANTACTSADSANTTGSSAYGQANTALTTAQGAFAKANSSNVVNDPSPQLSANLDAQTYSFENVSTISIESGERVDFKGSDDLANATFTVTSTGLEIYTREAGNSATTLRAVFQNDGDIVPGFDGENSLGKASKGWNNGYFADGAVIYMGGHEISQSSNVITVDADVSMNAWVGSSGRFDDIATVSDIWGYSNNKVLTTEMWEATKFHPVSSEANITLDFGANSNFNVAVGQSMTLVNPTNTKEGQTGSIMYSANGSHTVSYGSNWVFAGAIPTNSGNTAGRDILNFKVLPGGKILSALLTNVGL